jgi:Zn-dependent metalloprotease
LTIWRLAAVKKLLLLLTLTVLALSAFGILSKRASATKPLFATGSDDEKELAKRISLDALRDRALRRGVTSSPGNEDLAVERVEIDELKMAHTRVRQLHGGVRVWEGEAIVHLSPEGAVAGITDEMKGSIVVETTPNLDEKTALRYARKAYHGHAKETGAPKVDLYVYRGEEQDRLVYRVETVRLDGSEDTSMPVFFIDAHTGEPVDSYDNLQTGTGNSRYNGTNVPIVTSGGGTTFYLEDLGRKMGTFNMNSTGNETYGTGGTQSRFTDSNDIWDSAIQQAGVDAHVGAAKTFDYYQGKFGRNGIDGNYGPGSTAAGANGAVNLLVSRVHFGSSGRYNNAFWNGTNMSYGDGDGVNFLPLTTIDICGHEMTHGVTERTANLTYSKESGALNESWSDVMGSMVELYADGFVSADTWKIGEDAYTPGTAGDALRSMSNPNSVGDPDHYSLRLYPGTCTASSSNDNCGVHTNSSIANHAFYLIANGGTNRVSGVAVTGIGAAKAEQVWYKALTSYMTSSTNFAGARTATENAATALYGSGSAEVAGVSRGWCAVGVGTCPGTPTPSPTATPTSSPTPTPSPTPTATELIINGAFEGSASPWVGSGTGYFYTNAGNYPHGGTGYIYFGVNNSVTGQAYQQVSVPSTATGTLTFWLNVTSSETTTTTQYDRLFVDVRNTAGTLLATLASYSNLNKTTAGIYSFKSLNMAAYKGQTVRVQFRSTMDSSITTTFRVDDVSLK